MTLKDLEMLQEYWGDHPPLHTLVATYMGIKPQSRQTTSNVVELPKGVSIALTKDGTRPLQGKWKSNLAPVYDFEELKKKIANV